MNDIKSLKKRHAIDLVSFEYAKKRYYSDCFWFENPGYDENTANESYEKICEKLAEIIRICAEEAKVKENADIYRDTDKHRIPRANFWTDVTDQPITIGLFREFYIATKLNNPHNIKLMNDDFWGLLFRLSTLGKFTFKESEQPTKAMRAKYPQLFKKTGNYYKLLRNYFLCEVEHGKVALLGNISISWANDTPFSKLIPYYCEAFSIMYQLNYLLWKQDNKKAILNTLTG